MTAEQLEELLADLKHDGKFRRDAAMDDLAALAPSLARRVIAAEKLVEALDRIRTLNTIDVDDNGDTWVHSGLIEQEVWVAKCAYREASK